MEHHEIQVQLEHKVFLVCKVHPDPRDRPAPKVPRDRQQIQVLRAPLDEQVQLVALGLQVLKGFPDLQ